MKYLEQMKTWWRRSGQERATMRNEDEIFIGAPTEAPGTLDLSSFAKEVWQNAEDHGWHSINKTVGEDIALIHSELSEALDEFRNGHALDEIYVKDGKLEGYVVELADAVIRILDHCEDHKLPLEEALKRKHEYNKTRPYRHGGKKI